MGELFSLPFLGWSVDCYFPFTFVVHHTLRCNFTFHFAIFYSRDIWRTPLMVRRFGVHYIHTQITYPERRIWWRLALIQDRAFHFSFLDFAQIRCFTKHPLERPSVWHVGKTRNLRFPMVMSERRSVHHFLINPIWRWCTMGGTGARNVGKGN